MDNQTAGMTPDEFTAFVTLHGRLTGDEDLTNAAGSHRLTFADGTQIEAIANSDGSVNVTKYDKLVKPPAGSNQGPRTVKFNNNLYTEDSQGNMHLSMTGNAPNVPAADQYMPGTETPGGLSATNPAMGDAYNPGGDYTQSNPGQTVPVYNAETNRLKEQDTQRRQDAADALERARLAVEQTNSELTRGRDAITAAHDAGTLNLEQSKAAADLLYHQADIELRARIANQDYGQKVADLEMKRLPAGTIASFGPTAQAALQGRFVAPNVPQDNRDPTQIALKAIADLKAGMGSTPAMSSLAGSSYSGLNFTPGATGGTGLTLPPAGNTTTTTAAAQPTQPVLPPYFPRPGATTGPF